MCGTSFWAKCCCSSHEQDKPEGQSFRRANFELQTRLCTGSVFVFVPLHKRLCWGVQNRLYWRTCLWGLSCACSWSWLEASQLFILRLQNCAGVAGDRLCFAVRLASLLSCVPHRRGHAASLGGPGYSCAGCTGRVSACISPHTYPKSANSCGRSVWMTLCKGNTWTGKSPVARGSVCWDCPLLFLTSWAPAGAGVFPSTLFLGLRQAEECRAPHLLPRPVLV